MEEVIALNAWREKEGTLIKKQSRQISHHSDDWFSERCPFDSWQRMRGQSCWRQFEGGHEGFSAAQILHNTAPLMQHRHKAQHLQTSC